MSCSDTMKTLLSRYVDGELSDPEKSAAEEHLTACAPCRGLLGIFQKNENLVTSALSTDTFGKDVIAGVMGSLRAELPPEAKPVDEGPWEWLRTRPLVPLAAAALLVVGLLFVLSASHSGEMAALRTQVDASRKEAGEAKAAHETAAVKSQDDRRQLIALFDEQQREIVRARTDNALRHAGPGFQLGFVDMERNLVVKSAPDARRTTKYDVYRCIEKEQNWVKLTEEMPLDAPDFTDRTALPGVGYVYKFRSQRDDGSFSDSAPIPLRLPYLGDLSPDKSIRIRCIETGKLGGNAKFELERTVNGKPASTKAYAALGERVGSLIDVPGVGKVDFSTGLVLHGLKDGIETLTVQLISLVYDADSKPVLREISNGVLVPVTEREERTLRIRDNTRAILRSPSAPQEGDVDLWKGRWVTVRARE